MPFEGKRERKGSLVSKFVTKSVWMLFMCQNTIVECKKKPNVNCDHSTKFTVKLMVYVKILEQNVGTDVTMPDSRNQRRWIGFNFGTRLK